MLTWFKRIGLAAAIALSCASLAPDSADARELTMRETRRAIASGRALPFRMVVRRIRRKFRGEILDAALFQRPNGRLIYRIKVLTVGGAVRVVVIDAGSGRILNIR